jgi:hypothetical protein
MTVAAVLASGVFDTVRGLPVHILTVHAVVVGVPVMSLVTVVVAARPAWRVRAAWAVAAVDVLLLGLVWVTVQAGKALRERLADLGNTSEDIARHADLGGRMPWFAFGLAAAAVLSALAGRRRGLGAAALVLAVVAGVAATAWVAVTGEAGSLAVWGPIVQSTGG